MTLLLWMAFAMGISGNVNAGWEYNESARPKPPRAQGQVQVFGHKAAPEVPDVSVSDYADMLREDAAKNGEPRLPSASEDSAIDTEFQALRSRLRTRSVAEVAPRPSTTSRSSAIPPPPPMETEVITPQKSSGKKVLSSPGGTPSVSENEPARGEEVNAAFPYTHLLPSPYNIPGGSYVFGTSFAYGIFDSLQVSTNLARTIQQHWNFEAKVPLVEYPTFVASAFVDYESYNPRHIDDTNPDIRLNRWQPGLVTGYEITPDIAFFLGGNFNFGKDPVPVRTTSGYLRGAQANMEWSWLYNPAKSRLGNNAIALGIKYDFTYSLFGFGLTHHWRMFDLGVHYTFADRDRFLPIFGFNVGASF